MDSDANHSGFVGELKFKPRLGLHAKRNWLERCHDVQAERDIIMEFTGITERGLNEIFGQPPGRFETQLLLVYFVPATLHHDDKFAFRGSQCKSNYVRLITALGSVFFV